MPINIIYYFNKENKKNISFNIYLHLSLKILITAIMPEC